MDVISDVVFTTYQANANVQPAYQMQIVDDVANLPFVIRQQFAAIQLSRNEVRPNFERERQEREAVYIYWRVNADDLEGGSPSIFPEEVTNNYPPGYGPPLGEDWPNSDVKKPRCWFRKHRSNRCVPTKLFQQRQFSVTVVKIFDFLRLIVEIEYERFQEEFRSKKRHGIFDFCFQNLW